MKNKDKIKMKAGVLIIAWLLVCVSISSVLSGTVTNTDVKTTTTDSDLIIDYETGFVVAHNFTSLESFLFNGTVNRFINNSYDSKDTFICNSNGKYWAATGDNLQSAIDDLGIDGGVVWLPNATFSVMQVWINETNISLIGHNTKLEFDLTRFSDFTDNRGIITINADYTLVDNIEVDGSMIWNYSLNPEPNPNVQGIVLYRVKNCTIRNSEIHHIQDTGIKLFESNYTLIEYNHVHHIGNISQNAGVGSPGIVFADEYSLPSCSWNIVQYNYIHHIREHGIKIYESPPDDTTFLHNKILYNKIENCNLGDWDEDNTPYGQGIVSLAHGAIIVGNTVIQNKLMNIGIVTYGDCHIEGNTIVRIDGCDHTGIQISVGNVTVTNNYLNGNGYAGNTAGIYAKDGHNFTIIQNTVKDFSYSIMLQATAPSLTGSIVTENHLYGGTFALFDQVGTVHDNVITNNNMKASLFALQGGATLGNNTVKDNIGYDYSSQEYVPTGTSSPYQYKTVSAGAMWLNTTTNDLGIYNGTAWNWYAPN